MTRPTRRMLCALAALASTFAVTVGSADAGVSFADGTYASVQFRCESLFRTLDTVPEYGTGAGVYYRVFRYYADHGGFSNPDPWTPMGTTSLGVPIPASLSVGWLAFYVQYARWNGSAWDVRGEWASVYRDGTKGYWCWMA